MSVLSEVILLSLPTEVTANLWNWNPSCDKLSTVNAYSLLIKQGLKNSKTAFPFISYVHFQCINEVQWKLNLVNKSWCTWNMRLKHHSGSAEEEIPSDAFGKTIHCITFSTWFFVICCSTTLSWWRLLSVQIRSAISKQHSHYSFSWAARIFVTISISQSCRCCRNFKSVPLSATVSCQFRVKSSPLSLAPFASTLSHPAPSSRPLHHFWHIRVKCFERGNLGNLFISLHKSEKCCQGHLCHAFINLMEYESGKDSGVEKPSE